MIYHELNFQKKERVGILQVINSAGSRERMWRFADEQNECSLEAEEGEIGVWSFADPVARIDKPVIAAVKGDAVGQGLESALACDIRIATEGSHFGLPYIRSGYIPRGRGGDSSMPSDRPRPLPPSRPWVLKTMSSKGRKRRRKEN